MIDDDDPASKHQMEHKPSSLAHSPILDYIKRVPLGVSYKVHQFMKGCLLSPASFLDAKRSNETNKRQHSTKDGPCDVC